MRDWTEEGKEERDQFLTPIMNSFKKHFPHHIKPDQSLVKVLVPGAGLGRLVFEFAKQGYTA